VIPYVPGVIDEGVATVIVEVPEPPDVREIVPGLKDIVGQLAVPQFTPFGGVTLAERVIPPVSPILVAVIVEVVESPGFIEVGLSDELEMPKSPYTFTVTVIV